METNIDLIRFAGVKSDHKQEGYPDFFPVHHWSNTLQYNYVPQALPVQMPEYVGNNIKPFVFEADLGLHSLPLYDRVTHFPYIRSAEFVELQSNEPVMWITMKHIMLHKVNLRDFEGRLRMEVYFVFAQIRYEFFSEPGSEKPGKIVAQRNLKEDSEQLDDEPIIKPTPITAREKREERIFRFRFINRKGEPLSRQRFKITLDDGSTRAGKTNREGVGQVEGIVSKAETVKLTMTDHSEIKLNDSKEFVKELELELSEEPVDVTTPGLGKMRTSL